MKSIYTEFMPVTYLTTDEAAERLGVGRQRIYEWIAAGRLEAIKIRNSWMIEESLVQNFKRFKVGRPRKKKSIASEANSDAENP